MKLIKKANQLKHNKLYFVIITDDDLTALIQHPYSVETFISIDDRSRYNIRCCTKQSNIYDEGKDGWIPFEGSIWYEISKNEIDDMLMMMRI